MCHKSDKLYLGLVTVGRKVHTHTESGDDASLLNSQQRCSFVLSGEWI